MRVYNVLVLNNAYEPIGITNSVSVVNKIISGRNLLIEKYYPHTYTSAGNQVIQIPAVIRIPRYISIRSFNGRSCSKSDIYERDGRTCVYCGIKPKVLTVDHVLPKSRGGISSYSNLVTACQNCNSRKGDRTPEEANIPMLKKIPMSYNPTINLINKQGSQNEYWSDFLYI